MHALNHLSNHRCGCRIVTGVASLVCPAAAAASGDAIETRRVMDIGNGRVLTLRARIDNLFNKAYWASVGGTQGSNYLMMGQPRTFAVSGTIDF